MKLALTLNTPKIKVLKPFDFITTLKVETLLGELNPSFKINFAHVQ
jgi:hypothetical protein